MEIEQKKSETRRNRRKERKILKEQIKMLEVETPASILQNKEKLIIDRETLLTSISMEDFNSIDDNSSQIDMLSDESENEEYENVQLLQYHQTVVQKIIQLSDENSRCKEALERAKMFNEEQSHKFYVKIQSIAEQYENIKVLIHSFILYIF